MNISVRFIIGLILFNDRHVSGQLAGDENRKASRMLTVLLKLLTSIRLRYNKCTKRQIIFKLMLKVVRIT